MSEQNYEVTLKLSKENADRLDAFIEGVGAFAKMRERTEAAEGHVRYFAEFAGNMQMSFLSEKGRADKAEAEASRLRQELSATRITLARNCSDLVTAEQEVAKLRAELERVKAELAWPTPEDRQG